MMTRSDSEIRDLLQHLDDLRSAPWMDRPRQSWPGYLFHCTDILNVLSILRQGEMLSRTKVEEAGLLQLDIASPEVIEHTDLNLQDYVRLYFRPCTPTQYRNEGFRPIGQWAWNSHCPVPVYLIFDSVTLLSRSDCRFSDGNLSSTYVNVASDIAFLKQIPFELVYHVGWFDRSDPDNIVHHRNAEVLVPQRISLDSLRYIGCRSSAEYEMLLHLLPPNARSRWIEKIGLARRLFNRKWTFVEQVEMSSEQVVFRFNRSSQTPGPFKANVILEESISGPQDYWSDDEYQCNRTLHLSLLSSRNPLDYTVRLFLNDHLAYANRYQAEDLPF